MINKQGQSFAVKSAKVKQMNKNMKQLLLALKDQQLVVDEQHALLSQNFGHMVNHIFSNQLKQALHKYIHGQWWSLQRGSLTFSSSDVIQIVKATEITFKRRVITCKSGIMHEKKIDLKIELAVVAQFGHGLFDGTDHFFEHHIAQERDHLSSLMRMIVKKYLNLSLKTYGKRYTEMIAHKSLSSSRHELTKKIIYLDQ